MSDYNRGQLDLSDSAEHNAGLPSKIGVIPNIVSFGDSGDVFNHSPWRNLFLLLSSDPKCDAQLTAMASQLLLRARQSKIEFRGNAVAYTLDISGVNKKILESLYKIKSTNLLTIKLIYATETTRVPADALTPERMKCVLRPTTVAKMMRVSRFPATSCAIGFDVMARELSIYKKEVSGSMVREEGASSSQVHEGEAEESAMSAEVKSEWEKLLKVAQRETVASWMNTSSMYSASITQKEIYEECEAEFPGTIFWAGVHCIMTDVSNKKKAMEVTADVRARYENSNFYGDFKRKQSARGLTVTKTEAYISCLEAAASLMGKYLKASTGVSAKEVSIMDYVMKSVNERFDEAKVKLSSVADAGVSSSEPADIEAYITAAQKKMKELKIKTNVV